MHNGVYCSCDPVLWCTVLCEGEGLVLFMGSGTVNVQCYVGGAAVYNFKGKR